MEYFTVASDCLHLLVPDLDYSSLFTLYSNLSDALGEACFKSLQDHLDYYVFSTYAVSHYSDFSGEDWVICIRSPFQHGY